MTLGFCLHIYSITICWTLALCQTHGNVTLTKTGQGPLRFWWWKQHKAAEMEFKIGGGQEPNMSVCHRSRWETNTCRYLRARGPDTWCRLRENADWVGSFPSTSWVTVGAWALPTIWLRAPGKCELGVTCYDKPLWRLSCDERRLKRSKAGSRDAAPVTIVQREVAMARSRWQHWWWKVGIWVQLEGRGEGMCWGVTCTVWAEERRQSRLWGCCLEQQEGWRWSSKKWEQTRSLLGFRLLVRHLTEEHQLGG